MQTDTTQHFLLSSQPYEALFDCLLPHLHIKGQVLVGRYCILGELYGEDPLLIQGPACIRSHSVLYMGSSIAENFSTGHHVLIRNHCQIGHSVSIGSSTVIEHSVTIGNFVRIHSHCFIPEFCVLEDHAWIGPRVTFTNAKYPQSPNVKQNLKGPIIRRGAIIGANVTLLPEIEIGENAIIGAGSVVTKDVPANEVWAGNPATKIKCRDQLPYS